jgi:predicted transcriptional regulator
MALKAHEAERRPRGTDARAMVPAPVAWKQRRTKHTVVCLACGASFKQLSRHHLQIHHLDQRAYRAKYGIPRTQPLTAKVVSAQRKQLVQQSRPWEKAPRYLKAQARQEAVHARPTPPRRTRTRHPAPS